MVLEIFSPEAVHVRVGKPSESVTFTASAALDIFHVRLRRLGDWITGR